MSEAELRVDDTKTSATSKITSAWAAVNSCFLKCVKFPWYFKLLNHSDLLVPEHGSWTIGCY